MFRRCLVLALLFGHPAALVKACDMGTFFNLRREWASDGNPCQKKLPFDVWLVLVAHGSTFDVDAQAVLRDCVQYEAPAMLELSVNKVDHGAIHRFSLLTAALRHIPPHIRERLGASCVFDIIAADSETQPLKAWRHEVGSEYCGIVVQRTPEAAAIMLNMGANLEVICEDEDVNYAARVDPVSAARVVHASGSRRAPSTKVYSRHLQATVNEAVAAHEKDVCFPLSNKRSPLECLTYLEAHMSLVEEFVHLSHVKKGPMLVLPGIHSELGDEPMEKVDVLITGLEELRCVNTRGNSQTLCVMSDSFNANGNAETLQEQGDLPPVEVIFPTGAEEGSDEGSALIELAYDIAPAATYKFFSANFGELFFAAGIRSLGENHGCDVIVDDISYPQEPSFRDGPVAEAVNTVVNASNLVHVMSAANDGLGLRFTSDFECTTALFNATVRGDPCPVGVASHVFNQMLSETDPFRYLHEYDPIESSIFLLKWDEDEGSARLMGASFWVLTEDGELTFLSTTTEIQAGRATVRVAIGSYVSSIRAMSGARLFFAVHQEDEIPADLFDVDMHIISSRGGTLVGAQDSSMYGSQCANAATSVAAINYAFASGLNGTFADPETSPVETFSSRGGCIVRADGEIEERNKPETTAANRLSTSTPGWRFLVGTSASAPVVAGIITLVRAACAPGRVVGRKEVLEILSNYTYTIDYISDANGKPETFGPEAGYGIISGEMIEDLPAFTSRRGASYLVPGVFPTVALVPSM